MSFFADEIDVFRNKSQTTAINKDVIGWMVGLRMNHNHHINIIKSTKMNELLLT
ncbi:hypothetical protein SDC9_177637 [bioreactor metagenome]|uniref:Uncharacterized protein n=1 Tax=bioreactor metagenome TaxID=1076179 RepID=A0A645GWN2_9ZZZZ